MVNGSWIMAQGSWLMAGGSTAPLTRPAWMLHTFTGYRLCRIQEPPGIIHDLTEPRPAGPGAFMVCLFFGYLLN